MTHICENHKICKDADDCDHSVPHNPLDLDEDQICVTEYCDKNNDIKRAKCIPIVRLPEELFDI